MKQEALPILWRACTLFLLVCCQTRQQNAAGSSSQTISLPSSSGSRACVVPAPGKNEVLQVTRGDTLIFRWVGSQENGSWLQDLKRDPVHFVTTALQNISTRNENKPVISDSDADESLGHALYFSDDPTATSGYGDYLIAARLRQNSLIGVHNDLSLDEYYRRSHCPSLAYGFTGGPLGRFLAFALYDVTNLDSSYVRVFQKSAMNSEISTAVNPQEFVRFEDFVPYLMTLRRIYTQLNTDLWTSMTRGLARDPPFAARLTELVSDQQVAEIARDILSRPQYSPEWFGVWYDGRLTPDVASGEAVRKLVCVVAKGPIPFPCTSPTVRLAGGKNGLVAAKIVASSLGWIAASETLGIATIEELSQAVSARIAEVALSRLLALESRGVQEHEFRLYNRYVQIVGPMTSVSLKAP